MIELLEDSKALYKPCSKFDGVFVEPHAVFICNDGRGHFGDFVYIKDDRGVQEYLSLCEVQVFPFRSENQGWLSLRELLFYCLDKATCGFPEEPLHTLISQKDGVAIYSCEEGYILLGEEMHYCQEDGSWSGKLPMCIGKYHCFHSMFYIFILIFSRSLLVWCWVSWSSIPKQWLHLTVKIWGEKPSWIPCIL